MGALKMADLFMIDMRCFFLRFTCFSMILTPLTESVQRCSVAAEQLVAAEQIAEGQGKIRGILYRD